MLRLLLLDLSLGGGRGFLHSASQLEGISWVLLAVHNQVLRREGGSETHTPCYPHFSIFLFKLQGCTKAILTCRGPYAKGVPMPGMRGRAVRSHRSAQKTPKPRTGKEGQEEADAGAGHRQDHESLDLHGSYHMGVAQN